MGVSEASRTLLPASVLSAHACYPQQPEGFCGDLSEHVVPPPQSHLPIMPSSIQALPASGPLHFLPSYFIPNVLRPPPDLCVCVHVMCLFVCVCVLVWICMCHSMCMIKDHHQVLSLPPIPFETGPCVVLSCVLQDNWLGNFQGFS